MSTSGNDAHLVGDDAVLVFELGEPTVDGTGSDLIGDPQRPPRPPVLDRWPWWRRADRTSRITATVAAAGVVVAAVFGVVAARTPVRTKQLSVQRTIAPPAVAVDALGCPGVRACGVREVAESRLVPITRTIKSARVVATGETYDLETGTVYRRTVTIRATSTTIWLDGQCVPGSGPVVPAPMRLRVTNGSSSVYVPTGEIAPPGVRHLSGTFTGPAGCSEQIRAVSTLPTDLLDGLPLDYELAVLSSVTGMAEEQ